MKECFNGGAREPTSDITHYALGCFCNEIRPCKCDIIDSNKTHYQYYQYCVDMGMTQGSKYKDAMLNFLYVIKNKGMPVYISYQNGRFFTINLPINTD